MQKLHCAFLCAGIYGLLCLVNAHTNHPVLNLNIDINPFNCDCKDYEIISFCRFFPKADWLDKLQCEEPPDLIRTRVCLICSFSFYRATLCGPVSVGL